MIEEILDDPSLQFTTTPHKMMEFATFMHEMGRLKNKLRVGRTYSGRPPTISRVAEMGKRPPPCRWPERVATEEAEPKGVFFEMRHQRAFSE
jgi:hypothetical protein